MEDHILRLYASPTKYTLLLIGSLVFVVAALLPLQGPTVRADTGNTAVAYFALAFFGLCAVAALIALLRSTVLRHPVLEVDTQGWRYKPELGGRSQTVRWTDVGSVAIYRRQQPRSKAYYLVLGAKHPEQLSYSRARAIAARILPPMAEAAMAFPLNSVFVRTTPAKAETLLHDIQARFGSELYRNDIALDDTVRDV